MGLKEYLTSGAKLSRQIVQLQTNITGSGSVELGAAYALLSIETDVPCRIRLYDNAFSRDNVAEKARSFGDTNVPSNIALIGDISASSIGKYTLDPVVYGLASTSSNKLTYYKIDGTSAASINFVRYLLEDSTVSIDNRRTLPVIKQNVPLGGYITGTLTYDPISQIIIPQTYLLISASVSGSNTRARLRLYSTSGSLQNTTEISRSFTTESSATSKLIVDAVMSGGAVTYFVPKIIGANLTNMNNNLNSIRGIPTSIAGANEMYYILQNVATTPADTQISASLHVFSLED